MYHEASTKFFIVLLHYFLIQNLAFNGLGIKRMTQAFKSKLQSDFVNQLNVQFKIVLKLMVQL